MTDRSQTKGYTDDSPFVRLLATPSRVKILDVLLRRHASELTASEISEQAGIDEGTFSRNKDLFEELGIVESHEEGRTTYYRLKADSPVAKAFGTAHSELLVQAEELLSKTGRPSPDRVERIREFVRRQEPEGRVGEQYDVFDNAGV